MGINLQKYWYNIILVIHRSSNCFNSGQILMWEEKIGTWSTMQVMEYATQLMNGEPRTQATTLFE